jgi:dihydrolipoamide dehydrogenase
MNNLTVDVAVIGAGTAGMVAYRAAKLHGKRVVMIEGGPYGTTCARVGCMPSKLLIAAAEAAHAVSHAPGFGIHAAPIRIDGREVMARVRDERDRFVSFVLDGVESMPQEDRLRGHARFIGPNALQIDKHTIVHAERIVIATGSRPAVPDSLHGIGERLVTSDDIFEWTDLPESVAMIGTGVIGLELGQALHRLGVRVAIFGRSGNLAQLSDPPVLSAAARYLGDELNLRLGSKILAVQRDADQVIVRWSAADGTEHAERYDYVLAATGRVPNLDRIGLEHAALELDQAGIPQFDPLTMQCGDKPVFIAGDADNELPVLHEAADQGRIAGENAARFPDIRPGLHRIPFSIAFTDPQIAVVGQPYRLANKQRIVTGEVSFENQGRSRAMRQNRGLLRVYATVDSGQFIGAEMIGPRNEHLAHLLAWACQNKMTIEQMLEMPFYHPVIEEGLRTALRQAKANLLHGLPPIDHCTDCTPGV